MDHPGSALIESQCADMMAVLVHVWGYTCPVPKMGHLIKLGCPQIMPDLTYSQQEFEFSDFEVPGDLGSELREGDDNILKVRRRDLSYRLGLLWVGHIRFEDFKLLGIMDGHACEGFGAAVEWMEVNV